MDTYAGQHFYGEAEQRMRVLDESVEEMRRLGREKAEAEREYRVALAKRMWELRAAGMPVTGIGDLARGDENVSLLKLVRDSTESEYDAARESINVQKLQVRLLGEQLAREWGRAQ